MEDVIAQMGQANGQQSLNIVVKADVQGSAEALRESLTALSNDMIRINVIVSGVGGITESDATLAPPAKARHHRLQRPRRCSARAGSSRATGWTCATSRSSTTSSTR